MLKWQFFSVSLIKPVSLSIRTYVCPSTKCLSIFNKICCVGRSRSVLHVGMPYDSIQGHGQGYGGPKVAKIAHFKSTSFASTMHVIRIQMVNHDIPKQYQKLDT